MKITVGKGSCGIAAGASEIYNLLEQNIPAGCSVTVTGCVGMCYLEPIVNAGGVTFVKVNAKAAGEILKYIRGEENSAGQYIIQPEDLDNLNSQNRIALRNCGIIDPENIGEYISRDG